MIRRPPRSTPLSLHDALPIYRSDSSCGVDGKARSSPVCGSSASRIFHHHSARLLVKLSSPDRSVGGTEFRSEEHTSELQSLTNLVCRLLLEKKKIVSHRARHH